MAIVQVLLRRIRVLEERLGIPEAEPMPLLRISEEAAKVWGYYSSPEQTTPVYDPGLAPCPMCGLMVTMEDVRTITVMYTASRALACFYRVHRSCHERLRSEDRVALESRLMDLLPMPVAAGEG